MDSRDAAVLNRILSEASILSNFIVGMSYGVFANDEKTKRAVCMSLINIGEMVKLLSDQAKEKSIGIPWRQVAGLRDVTAHGYQTLHMEDIWETVITDIPIFQAQIQALLSGYTADE
jgi:uncharacterized protein with HEPN domain